MACQLNRNKLTENCGLEDGINNGVTFGDYLHLNVFKFEIQNQHVYRLPASVRRMHLPKR